MNINLVITLTITVLPFAAVEKTGKNYLYTLPSLYTLPKKMAFLNCDINKSLVEEKYLKIGKILLNR